MDDGTPLVSICDMNNRSALLIWNPRAGRGHAQRRASEVERFCETLTAGGVATAATPTTAPGDATRLAREAIKQGVRDIIVAGGDGTINEALQGIINKPDVRLGVWARGTANVLARELRLPFDAEGAARVIIANHTRAVHVGCAVKEACEGANGSPLTAGDDNRVHTDKRRYFFLMAGIGLDASIVRRVPALLKRHAGEAAFWYSGLAHLAQWQPAVFQIETGGETFAATFAAIGKAPRYGGGLRVTPGARLCDPQFQVCIVDSHSRLRYLHLLAHAAIGGVGVGRTDARLMNTTSVRATGDALVQLDGELVGTLPMRFEVCAQPVTVFAPE
jgi:YegS/Rv2252/BmrU family lipid kinase